MFHRKFVALMMILTLIGWGSFVSILRYSRPDEGFAVILLFYFSLGVALFSVIGLINFYLSKRWIENDRDREELISRSMRNAFVITFLMIGCLVLRSFDVFSSLIGLIAFFALLFIGLFVSPRFL